MSQLHNRLTDEQVKVLLQGYCQGIFDKILFADFFPKETTWAHVQAAQALIQSYGLPLRYYVDSLRVFRFVHGRNSFPLLPALPALASLDCGLGQALDCGLGQAAYHPGTGQVGSPGADRPGKALIAGYKIVSYEPVSMNIFPR